MALEEESAAWTAPDPRLSLSRVSVRTAVRADSASLARLSQELLAFYGLPVQYQRSYMAHVIGDRAFRDPPSIEILLAEDRGEPIGFLAFSEHFALANCQMTAFIQDIFVTRKSRRGGIGRKLMIALARICQDRGIGQLDWTADPWNGKARQFYEELGPLLNSEKTYYRMLAPRIAEIARMDAPDDADI